MPPRSRHSSVRSVRTPEAIQALVAQLDSFSASTQELGRDDLKDGAVTAVWSHADHIVKATVDDERRHDVNWVFARNAWTSQCTCADGPKCRHAYASGFAWITAVESGARDGRDPGDEPPAAAPAVPLNVSSSAEHALEAELLRWLNALPSPEEEKALAENSHALTDLAGLRVRLDHAGNWFVEVRAAADKPWKAPSQRWLTDLARLRPADFQALPPAEAALAAALATEARLSTTGLAPKKSLPGEAVVALLRTAAVRSALALPDGTPFEIEPLPLVPEATEAADEPDRFDLHLVTPEGIAADTAVFLTPRPEPLYLFEGRVWRGPPRVPSKRLPAAALSDARLLPRLHAVGLRLPEGVQAELRVIKLRPRLKCWLSPAFDGVDERDFNAQLIARSDHPPCEQEFTNEARGWRWRKDAEPPPRVVGEPALQFDASAALAASARFDGFRMIWDGWAGAWIRPVSDDFAEEFLDWHAKLPRDLAIDLSPELASLLGEPLSARVELSVAAASDNEQDWFDLTVGLKVEDTTLKADEIALLLKARGKWVNLPRHGWRRVVHRF